MIWQERFLFTIKNLSEKDSVVFSTSFSLEDQIITDFIVKNKLPIAIFTIDTGRLFNQTYQVWQKTLDVYGIKIATHYPDQQRLGEFVGDNGIDAFYNSKDLRINCCEIRKIEPLKKALSNKTLWIGGLRKEHSSSRNDKDFLEYDVALKINKFYPLLEESEAQIWKYIDANNVPYNQLYDQGFKSIGCAPCTRTVSGGEEARAGRWWWEEDQKKECGIHK